METLCDNRFPLSLRLRALGCWPEETAGRCNAEHLCKAAVIKVACALTSFKDLADKLTLILSIQLQLYGLPKVLE